MNSTIPSLRLRNLVANLFTHSRYLPVLYALCSLLHPRLDIRSTLELARHNKCNRYAGAKIAKDWAPNLPPVVNWNRDVRFLSRCGKYLGVGCGLFLCSSEACLGRQSS